MKAQIFAGLIIGFIFLHCSVAHAHVVVSPKTVTENTYQTFSVSVPVERDAPVIAVRVVIPANLESIRPTVKSGWKITTNKESRGDKDVITEILWTGNQIPAGYRDDFTFSARVTGTSTLTWKAYQTYRDGVIVAWDMSPEEHSIHSSFSHEAGSAGPYSMTTITPSAQHTSTHTSQNSAHTSHGSTYLSLFAMAIAFGTFLMVVKKVE
jgi:uncharacterized protein YcnI